MNKRSTKYIMITVVLAIWVVVILRSANVFPGDKKMQVQKVAQMESIELGKFTADSFSLELDYRDPFLGKYLNSKPLQQRIIPKFKKKKEVPKSPPPPTDWSFIRYNGYAKSETDTVMDALVKIHNQLFHVEEGKSYEGVRILSLYKDSIRVGFKDEEKTISLR